jgi:hypothetical protein
MPLMTIVMLLIILAPPAALDFGPARPPTLTSMLPRPGGGSRDQAQSLSTGFSRFPHS